MRTHSHAILIGAAAILAAAAVQAAPITWSPAANTGGKADLIEPSGADSVVIALNGGTPSPTVTGGGAGGSTDYSFTTASFDNLGIHTFVADVGGPTPQFRVQDNVYGLETITSSGDANYDTMLASVTDTWGTPAGITAGTLTLNGLVEGGAYTIQVFYNDQRDTTDDRVMTYGDGEAVENTVDLAGGDPAAGVQTGHYGQYAVGSFTASGTSQDLTMTAVGFGNGHFTAIVVTGPAGANIPPEFEFPSQLFEIIDGDPIGTTVGTVTATDPDGGPGAIVYSIPEGNESGAFAIDSATGEITVAGTIDINVEFTYTLTVDAFDGEDRGDTIVWVDVLDAPAPPVTVAFANSVLDEAQWNSNGYGDIGYLFANTDDNDLEAGNYKRGGAVYNASETPEAGQTIMFTQLAGANAAGGTIAPPNELTASIEVDLENPDGGTFQAGRLFNWGLADNTPSDLCTLTFDEAVPDGYRLGILVGAGELQGTQVTIDATTGNLRDIPYQLQVDSVSTPTTQTALDVPSVPEWLTTSPDHPDAGVPRADWYFFDLTDIEAGASVTISAARVYSGGSHKFSPINGVVIASLVPGTPDPVITGVSLSGTILTIDFTGEPGVTDWKVMAGTDLQGFPDDKTPASIPESPAGVYQAQVDVSGDPAAYFMRIER